MKTLLAVAMGVTLAFAAFGCANTAEDCALIGLCGGQDVPGTGGMGGAGGLGGAGGTGGMGGAGGMAQECTPPLLTLSATDMQSAENVHLAGDGTIVVTGNLAGTLVLGPTTSIGLVGSNPHFFLARYTADLTIVNALDIDAMLLDSAMDSQGNLLAIGTHAGPVVLPEGCAALPDTSGVFVFKLDTANKCVWAKSYTLGAGSEIAAHVAVGANGDIALAGAFSGSIKDLVPAGTLTSVGTKDIFVAKLNAMGDSLWGGSYGEAGQTQVARAVAEGALGDVLVAGDYQGTLNLHEAKLGTMMTTNRAGFVAKFANDGKSVSWQKSFVVDSGTQHITAMAVNGSNDVVVAGDINGTSIADKLDTNHRLFLAKLGSTNGLTSLVKGYAGSGTPAIHDIAVMTSGRIVLTGHSNDKLDFGDGDLGAGMSGERSFWTILDKDGANSHSTGAGDDAIGEKRGLGVAVNATRAFVVGHFEGAMSVAGQSRTSGGDKDIFATELCLP